MGFALYRAYLYVNLCTTTTAWGGLHSARKLLVGAEFWRPKNRLLLYKSSRVCLRKKKNKKKMLTDFATVFLLKNVRKKKKNEYRPKMFLRFGNESITWMELCVLEIHRFRGQKTKKLLELKYGPWLYEYYWTIINLR